MYIIFCIISPSATPQLVGHVGSNKYRAVANLKYVAEDWIKKNTSKIESVGPVTTTVSEWTEVNKEAHVNEKSNNGTYIVNNNEFTKSIFTVSDCIQKGWVWNGMKKVVDKRAVFYLAESKKIEHVKTPSPDEDKPVTIDDMMAELKDVIAARFSKTM